MKRIGLLLMLAGGIAVGCNNRTDNGAVRTTGNGDYGTTGTTGTAGTATAKSGDIDFVHDLTIANKAEVELGKLAQQKSSNAAVKNFGQMMVDDHTAAGTKLAEVASMHHIDAPAALDQKHQDLYDKLSKLQGDAFDREYMSAMVDGHQDVLSDLEGRIDKPSLSAWKKIMDAVPGNQTPTQQPPTVVAETSDDPTTMSINQWAATAYPTVYKHLQSAKRTNDAVTHNQRTTQ
ncbi:MAG TPA: DUF4142 domain-containing protein [Vicinamibacterales bacterium]|jgi:putative membrane protein|nr:DUF4142 domain-containing protein [Vicinamibacterales bacterium]